MERLAKIAELKIDIDTKKLLRKLTKAQISSRYESYKQKVMEEFSKEFVRKIFPKILTFYECIKKKI